MKFTTLEGNAIVYCEGAFGTTNGKTAHGLVRRSNRYRVTSVVDSRCAGADAGTALDGCPRGIPIEDDLLAAVRGSLEREMTPTHLVIGMAPDGGRLDPMARADIKRAIRLGLNIDSGLHDFLSEDPEMVALAEAYSIRLRDIRKPPPRSELHFFTGKIEEVTSVKVAVLGTDSAVGKCTTAWLLVDALRDAGYTAEMIGTGQTAWLQGVRYGVVLDSLVNDFVAGELEHSVWSAWVDHRPDVLVIEGQGSLMNPAYPGGFEILAATRPDAVVLQHAPHRSDYDGFPGYPIHSLRRQIEAIDVIADRPVVAVAINREGIPPSRFPAMALDITREVHLPAIDVLHEGAHRIVRQLAPCLPKPPGSITPRSEERTRESVG